MHFLGTVFILINAPGVLQFRSPTNDVLKTKYRQRANIPTFQCLEAILHGIWSPFFPLQMGGGGTFIREGAFIRINMVYFLL